MIPALAAPLRQLDEVQRQMRQLGRELAQPKRYFDSEAVGLEVRRRLELVELVFEAKRRH